MFPQLSKIVVKLTEKDAFIKRSESSDTAINAYMSIQISPFHEIVLNTILEGQFI